jgi:hypothetical protein
MAIGPWSYTLSRIATIGAAFERLSDRQVCTVCQLLQSRINPLGVLNSRADDEDFAFSLDPEAVAAKLGNRR